MILAYWGSQLIPLSFATNTSNCFSLKLCALFQLLSFVNTPSTFRWFKSWVSFTDRGYNRDNILTFIVWFPSIEVLYIQRIMHWNFSLILLQIMKRSIFHVLWLPYFNHKSRSFTLSSKSILTSIHNFLSCPV